MLHHPLYKFFELNDRNTTVLQELRGAAATFLTMVYILFANSAILSAAGLPANAVVAGTAAAAGVCSILMGLWGNFPIALASGMGLNAVVAFHLAKAAGSWQTAMGLVVLDGLAVLILVLLGFREAVMKAIPKDLRKAIGAGIGLFIAFIGAVNGRLVMVNPGAVAALQGAKDPYSVPAMPPVHFGNLTNSSAIITIVGLVVISFLVARRVKGAIVIGITLGTLLSLALGVSSVPERFSLPSFDTFFQADVMGALAIPTLIPLLVSLVLVDFFDTLGTVTAIADQGKILDSTGSIPRLKQILLVDSISASIGGLFGVSSVTSYVESAAGVAEGARTGLHSVFVGLMFLAAIFIAPLASMVSDAATAPALIIVGFLMCEQIREIEFSNLETGIPAFITLAILPFTFSITHGIGYGFIAYVAIKVLSGKFRQVHPLMYVIAAVFAAYFVFGQV